MSINLVGCLVCRKEYNVLLKEYFDLKVDILCDICNERREKNLMRVIDCKNFICKENIKDILFIVDYLCDDCKFYFDKF